ncbi:hypothetical protein B5C34_12715 [Pacificimonas flava]|uniref:Thioredoxin-like fold domain-containing protein n=2 Tax=Pacificimonas TaxID=1960290 RepID=A0A219B7S3_9SPHN|nr:MULTISPECIES: thioredoxin domain-containing protein [Pacificimonas]MBZ6378471.1 thioredoxin domain-containing protein [Pacificimonas aurantium]OWV34234.1 hypothetical protein B5C34_12715 [Pacificimonas flava]
MNFSLKSTASMLAAAALLAACNSGDEATAGAAEAGADSNLKAAEGSENWVRTIAKTEEGGYRIGNPDAPVKLVEFASLACPHCATFHEEAMPELKGEYIASGDVSYELRTFVLNQPDFVVTAVARCQTPEAFFALADAFFENQRGWLGNFQQMERADLERLGTMDPQDAMVEFGRMGGVDEFVRARGIPGSKFESCVRDEETLAEVEAIRQDAVETYDLTGTPTFVVNGERIDASTWEQVKERLDAAL